MNPLLSALLTITIWPFLSQCATSENGFEVDIIYPMEGGRYRVNQDRGMGVVIAVQNPRAAELYGWHVSWQVRSFENRSEGDGYPGQSNFFDLGGIGRGNKTDLLYPKHDIQQDDRIYIGLTHSYLYGDKPDRPMPPGDYRFTWAVITGPTCYSGPDGWGFNTIGDRFGEGAFNITIADDAPWPDLRPSPCAALAGQASSSATLSSLVSWTIPTTTPLRCAGTLTVTASADPCLATIGPDQARSISSIMTWDNKPPTLTTSVSAPTTTSKTSGAVGMGSPLLSANVWLMAGFFSWLALIGGYNAILS